MILMTLFVLKVSWISLEKMSGETLMILNLSIVEVSPKKLIMEIHNGIKIDTYDSLSTKGELDDDEEADWRDSDDYEAIDSEVRPHKTCHGDSQQN